MSETEEETLYHLWRSPRWELDSVCPTWKVGP